MDGWTIVVGVQIVLLVIIAAMVCGIYDNTKKMADANIEER